MKTITVSEALEMSGMPIPRITGTVKKIWERKTGSNDNGDWSMQSGILSDNGGEIKFTMSGFGEFPYKEGTKVIFRSKEGKKGMTGVKVKAVEYQGKSSVVLWVTPTAIVLSDSEESDAIPMEFDEKGESTTSTKPQSQPKASVEPKKAIPANGVNVVKHRLMQMANFRALCDSTVDYLYGDEADPQLKKDVSSCFFIQGLREGLEKQLPDNKPLSKKENDGASEPEMAEKDVEF